MRISHTRRSRSPVTHPKRLWTPLRGQYQQPHPVRGYRPITISPIRPTAPIIGFYRPSRRCHGFCKAWALTLPPQSCAVKPPSRVAVLVPAVDHSARRHHRPAPRDGLPLLLYRPGQESQRSRASWIFLLALAPLRHMPSAATCRLKSLYFYGNLMKGRRALPTLSGINWAKKTAPAADSTAILKLQRT